MFMHTLVRIDAIIILVTPPQYIISFVAFNVTRIPSPKESSVRKLLSSKQIFLIYNAENLSDRKNQGGFLVKLYIKKKMVKDYQDIIGKLENAIADKQRIMFLNLLKLMEQIAQAVMVNLETVNKWLFGDAIPEK